VVREKVAPEYLEQEYQYSPEHWDLFQNLRSKAYAALDALQAFSPLIHGSIARGDISKTSDIDIIIPYQISDFQIVANMRLYEPLERWIVQATPLSAIKGVIIFSISPEISVTFPLVPFYPRENEFYTFGGVLSYQDLSYEVKKRVPGVNKKLFFVDPTENGHREYRVTPDNASIVAKNLNIGVDTIYERIRVLERRDKVGRTGIFKKRLLTPSEAFGAVLQEIAATDPASRRRIKRKKIG
jgi:predicted nucleotidyltransferase